MKAHRHLEGARAPGKAKGHLERRKGTWAQERHLEGARAPGKAQGHLERRKGTWNGARAPGLGVMGTWEGARWHPEARLAPRSGRRRQDTCRQVSFLRKGHWHFGTESPTPPFWSHDAGFAIRRQIPSPRLLKLEFFKKENYFPQVLLRGPWAGALRLRR